MDTNDNEVLGTFYGDEEFPITWEEGQRELFWIYDDLHCPNPVSPMFFDIGGWWLTCDHMFRRFGTPFASDWIAKNVNGYVYTAAVPADSSIRAEATEYQNRYVPRVRRDPSYPQYIGAYMGTVLPHYAQNFLDWWRERLRPEIERNFAYLDGYDTEHASLVELAVLLEDAIDIHDRHWKIHWMLNFAQFSATQRLRATMQQVRGHVDEELLGRLQNSAADRNWDSVEGLWRMKELVKKEPALASAVRAGDGGGSFEQLQASDVGAAFLKEHLEPYQREFGWRAVWSHEFIYPTFREQPEPILEQIRGYLDSDYDYPSVV